MLVLDENRGLLLLLFLEVRDGVSGQMHLDLNLENALCCLWKTCLFGFL